MDGFKKILAGLKTAGEQIVDFSGDFTDLEGALFRVEVAEILPEAEVTERSAKKKAPAKRKSAQSKPAPQNKSEAQDAKE